MTEFFLRIYDFLEKRRGLTVALALTLTAVFAFLASRVRYEEDISKFLPRDGESRKYQEVYQQFALWSFPLPMTPLTWKPSRPPCNSTGIFFPKAIWWKI